MPWRAGPGAGFTEPGVEPWLPLGDAASWNVADQRDDPRSTLSFTRDLLALRRRTPDLQSGDYTPLDAPAGVWAWRRGGTTVAVNISPQGAELPDLAGTVRLSTGRDRDGERVDGDLALRGGEGVVLS
jgi:alpha-glucosidase